MSKAKRLPDAERTAIMLDLVRQLHEPEYSEQRMSLSTVVLEEVAPGTGWSGAVRWADVLALGVWKSTGQRLDGYEIKASRADLKRELADPSKHEAVARYCDRWTLVAWDDSVLVDGIPESWGIMLVERDGQDGDFTLVTRRKAQQREPQPWPRQFVCSLLRNAYEQNPSAAWVGRAATEAYRRGIGDGRRQAEAEKDDAVLELAKHYYGEHGWYWHKADCTAEKLVARALADLKQRELFAQGASA